MIDGKPTATEFMRKEEIPSPRHQEQHQVIGWVLGSDGRLEMTHHEPYDDDVPESIIICDECGDVLEDHTALRNHLKIGLNGAD